MFLAQPHYDVEVHTPFLGFPESTNLTSEELLELTITESDDVRLGKNKSGRTFSAQYKTLRAICRSYVDK